MGRLVLAIVAVIGALSLTVSQAGAAVLCQHRKSGSIAVREATCKRKEVPLDITTFLPGDETDEPEERYRVVDVQGWEVGTVKDLSLSSVLIRSNDKLFLFQVQRTGFVESSRLVFFYESSDCTGTPLLADTPRTNHAFTIQTLVRGGTAYYPIPAVADHTVQSTLSVEDMTAPDCDGVFTPPDRCCVTHASFSMTGAPYETLDLGGLGFTPPFRIERE
jgi:hypothetical protein